MGRQLRFLTLTLGAWAGLRAWMLWPAGQPIRVAARQERSTVSPRTVRPALVKGLLLSSSGPARERTGIRQARPERNESGLQPIKVADVGRLAEAATVSPPVAPKGAVASAAPQPSPSAAPVFTLVARSRHDWEGEAYLFYRPDSHQTSLAAGGQLGGSQFAARIAWRPNGGPFGLAVRAYAPIGERGAEAAAGIDWHPFDDAPVRVSIERRQRLDALGRSAWSAYAAGGFYRSRGRAELDGYAQAGIVGTQRRDGFVDGALRIGYRLPTRALVPILGAGLWGAAQPGVSRLDIGPRAALRIPVGPHMLTAALDGRLRLAGDARPGSGAALTIAADW